MQILFLRPKDIENRTKKIIGYYRDQRS